MNKLFINVFLLIIICFGVGNYEALAASTLSSRKHLEALRISKLIISEELIYANLQQQAGAIDSSIQELIKKNTSENTTTSAKQKNLIQNALTPSNSMTNKNALTPSNSTTDNALIQNALTPSNSTTNKNALTPSNSTTNNASIQNALSVVNLLSSPAFIEGIKEAQGQFAKNLENSFSYIKLRKIERFYSSSEGKMLIKLQTNLIINSMLAQISDKKTVQGALGGIFNLLYGGNSGVLGLLTDQNKVKSLLSNIGEDNVTTRQNSLLNPKHLPIKDRKMLLEQ